MELSRRSFIKVSGTLLASQALTSCSGENLSAKAIPIACYGDSLTAGLGGIPLATLIRSRLPGRTVFNFGISGQKADQIAARQGGIPTRLSIVNNTFQGVMPVRVTDLSVQLLSSPATKRELSLIGTLNGVHCQLTRTVIAHEAESYTVRADAFSNQPIPPESIFVPDTSTAYRSSIHVLWLGRNDSPNFEGVESAITSCVDYLTGQKQHLVIGILSNLNETVSTASYNRIFVVNESLQKTYPSVYISASPPTADELEAVRYQPTRQDRNQIEAGTFPTGLRYGFNHLNTTGYNIIAGRVVAKLQEKKW